MKWEKYGIEYRKIIRWMRLTKKKFLGAKKKKKKKKLNVYVEQ